MQRRSQVTNLKLHSDFAYMVCDLIFCVFKLDVIVCDHRCFAANILSHSLILSISYTVIFLKSITITRQ